MIPRFYFRARSFFNPSQKILLNKIQRQLRAAYNGKNTVVTLSICPF